MRLRLTSRIVLLFTLSAAVLLAIVGALAYRSGAASLKDAAISEMLAKSMEKEAALNGWFQERVADVRQLGNDSELVTRIESFLTAPPGSDAEKALRELIRQELRTHAIGAEANFIELFIIEANVGKVVVSTRPSEEGKSKADHSYFESGKNDFSLLPPYHSAELNALTMTAALPLRASDGRLMAVLAARLNLTAMHTITQRRTGLRKTEDSFLVNADRFLVTQPRFLSEPAVLKRQINTEAVRHCVARDSGVILAPNYLGIPTIAVYRWTPAHQLGLIIEIHQVEALAPARAFGESVMVISTLALLASAALGLLLARTITYPLRRLHDRVNRFAEGSNDALPPKMAGDEVDLLANEFDQMAARVAERTAQLAHSNEALQRENAERLRAQETLRASESEFRTLAESMPQIVWGARPDGWPVYLNPQWMEYTGISFEQGLGRGWSKAIHPEDQSRARRAWAGATATKNAFSLEVRMRRADGVYRWWLVRAVPLQDAGGNLLKWIGTNTDIQDMKLAELEILQAKREIEQFNAHLEKRVEQRTEALCAATLEAERANNAKSEFLSRMSHELRTPMNAILGFAQVLEIEESLTLDQRASVQYILKGGRHLLSLINEVLDLSIIETGRMTLSTEAIEVTGLLEETVGLLRPLAAEFNVRIAAIPGESIGCHMQADRQRLKQVLLNILGNAVKYNRPGGTVTIRCDALGARANGGSPSIIRLSVTDTGAGLGPEKLARLFQPFERLGAEQTLVKGTGLGLVLAKRMVEHMHGRLGVESVLGEGTTFWIELPTAESPIELEDCVSDSSGLVVPEVSAATRVLLYIEDNPSNIVLVTHILERRPGIELICAKTGALGLEMAREHRPDLILLDLHLPDSHGAEVLARLIADPRTTSIPVVMLSADAAPGKRVEMLAAGARAFITKPLDVRNFLSVVDRFLEMRLEEIVYSDFQRD
jgi:PAS domain S-box-containing protein